MPDERVTLREAAIRSGVSEGAIRKRVARGTIHSEMGDDGLRYVWVDAGTDGGEDASYTTGSDRDELLGELREQVAYLRSQLDVRAEEIQRRDVIISQLTQATSNLTDRLRELEAPSEQQAPSASPSVLRGSMEEGGKEGARLLVGGIAGLVVGVPSALASLISYFNDAPILTILTAAIAVVGILVGLVGTYFGVKASSDAVEGAQRIAAEYHSGQAAQEAREDKRDDG